jgi:hypothetical protein
VGSVRGHVFFDVIQLNSKIFSKPTERGSSRQFVKDRAIVVGFDSAKGVTSIENGRVCIIAGFEWINPNTIATKICGRVDFTQSRSRVEKVTIETRSTKILSASKALSRKEDSTRLAVVQNGNLIGSTYGIANSQILIIRKSSCARCASD